MCGGGGLLPLLPKPRSPPPPPFPYVKWSQNDQKPIERGGVLELLGNIIKPPPRGLGGGVRGPVVVVVVLVVVVVAVMSFQSSPLHGASERARAAPD